MLLLQCPVGFASSFQLAYLRFLKFQKLLTSPYRESSGNEETAVTWKWLLMLKISLKCLLRIILALMLYCYFSGFGLKRTPPNPTIQKKTKTSSRSTIEVVSSFLGIANGWKILCFQFMTAKFRVEDTDVFALEPSACDSLAYSQHWQTGVHIHQSNLMCRGKPNNVN